MKEKASSRKSLFWLILTAGLVVGVLWLTSGTRHAAGNALHLPTDNTVTTGQAVPPESGQQPFQQPPTLTHRGQDPLKTPFDAEKFYAGLSLDEKTEYLMTCLKIVWPEEPGGETNYVLRDKVLGEELLVTTEREKKIAERIMAKCRKLAGMEKRLYEDFAFARKTGKELALRLRQRLLKLLDEDPEAARALFWQSLTSPDFQLRYTGFSLFSIDDADQKKYRLDQLMGPLNQRLGLDFFHPEQEKGWRLLTTAINLSACQRTNSCGGDSLLSLNHCMTAAEFCGLSNYDITALMHSPADMEIIDTYLQFLLAQPVPAEDWLNDLSATKEPTTGTAAATTNDGSGR